MDFWQLSVTWQGELIPGMGLAGRWDVPAAEDDDPEEERRMAWPYDGGLGCP